MKYIAEKMEKQDKEKEAAMKKAAVKHERPRATDTDLGAASSSDISPPPAGQQPTNERDGDEDMGIPEADSQPTQEKNSQEKRGLEEDVEESMARRPRLNAMEQAPVEFHIGEIFSQPRVCPVARAAGLKAGYSLDIQYSTRTKSLVCYGTCGNPEDKQHFGNCLMYDPVDYWWYVLLVVRGQPCSG